ncbi:hypothetical protein RQP46_007955 [Phenoliferia psychrophenolica]
MVTAFKPSVLDVSITFGEFVLMLAVVNTACIQLYFCWSESMILLLEADAVAGLGNRRAGRVNKSFVICASSALDGICLLGMIVAVVIFSWSLESKAVAWINTVAATIAFVVMLCIGGFFRGLGIWKGSIWLLPFWFFLW